MAKEDIITKLEHYASYNINELTKHDSLLGPINDLVQIFVSASHDESHPISDSEAQELTKYLPEDHIETPFSNETVKDYFKIGERILDVATDTSSNNEHLQLVTKYLHPLFSQDDRTVDMGFDLEEYMDWYFQGTSREEREKYVKELLGNWSDFREI